MYLPNWIRTAYHVSILRIQNTEYRNLGDIKSHIENFIMYKLKDFVKDDRPLGIKM